MFKKFQAAVSVAILLLPICVLAQEEFKLDTEEKTYSYAIGLKLGERMLTQFNAENGFEMQALLEGLVTSVSGKDRLLSDDEIESAIQKREQELVAMEKRKALEKLESGKAFLAHNKSIEGVTVTASGLQYAALVAGEGDSPSLIDTVLVHYHGTLMDGTVFDSSYDRGQPVSFSLQSIIPGWQEVLQLMKPGDKWHVVLPPDLAYGDRGAGSIIGPNEVLLFDIELLEVGKPGNQIPAAVEGG